MTQTLATQDNVPEGTQNDLYVVNGNIAVAYGIQAVLQACATAAKTQLGEVIYNTAQGVPNFQTIWSGSLNIPQWRIALTQILQGIPDVVNVISLEVQVGSNNVLSYQAVILTTYGQGNLNGNF
jgi:hypothetical protein